MLSYHSELIFRILLRGSFRLPVVSGTPNYILELILKLGLDYWQCRKHSGARDLHRHGQIEGDKSAP